MTWQWEKGPERPGQNWLRRQASVYQGQSDAVVYLLHGSALGHGGCFYVFFLTQDVRKPDEAAADGHSDRQRAAGQLPVWKAADRRDGLL